MHAIPTKQGPYLRVTESGKRNNTLVTFPGRFALPGPVKSETLHKILVCQLSGRQQSAGDPGKDSSQMPLGHDSEPISASAFHPAREATCREHRAGANGS